MAAGFEGTRLGDRDGSQQVDNAQQRIPFRQGPMIWQAAHKRDISVKRGVKR
jgi:hypothetical protein